MKYLLPLLALAILLTACSSTPPRRVHWETERRSEYRAEHSVRGTDVANATRRSLYSPSRGSGPYTRQLQDESWKYASKTADEEMLLRREQQEIQAMQAIPKAKP